MKKFLFVGKILRVCGVPFWWGPLRRKNLSLKDLPRTFGRLVFNKFKALLFLVDESGKKLDVSYPISLKEFPKVAKVRAECDVSFLGFTQSNGFLFPFDVRPDVSPTEAHAPFVWGQTKGKVVPSPSFCSSVSGLVGGGLVFFLSFSASAPSFLVEDLIFVKKEGWVEGSFPPDVRKALLSLTRDDVVKALIVKYSLLAKKTFLAEEKVLFDGFVLLLLGVGEASFLISFDYNLSFFSEVTSNLVTEKAPTFWVVRRVDDESTRESFALLNAVFLSELLFFGISPAFKFLEGRFSFGNYGGKGIFVEGERVGGSLSSSTLLSLLRVVPPSDSILLNLRGRISLPWGLTQRRNNRFAFHFQLRCPRESWFLCCLKFFGKWVPPVFLPLPPVWVFNLFFSRALSPHNSGPLAGEWSFLLQEVTVFSKGG